MTDVATITDSQLEQRVQEIKTNPAFMEMLERVSAFKSQAPIIRVKTEADQVQAVESVGAIKGLVKDLEALRVAKVAFPNQLVKSINGMIKPLQEQLKDSETTIMGQVSKFKRVQEEKARAERARVQARFDKERAKAQAIEDERVRKEQAIRDAEYEEKRKAVLEAMAKAEADGQQSLIDDEPKEIVREVVEKVEVPRVVAAEPETKGPVRSESATSYTKTTWKFEVTDVMALAQAVIDGKVGPEAITANDKAIRAMVSAGFRTIPGVNIWEQEDIVTRSR